MSARDRLTPDQRARVDEILKHAQRRRSEGLTFPDLSQPAARMHGEGRMFITGSAKDGSASLPVLVDVIAHTVVRAGDAVVTAVYGPEPVSGEDVAHADLLRTAARLGALAAMRTAGLDMVDLDELGRLTGVEPKLVGELMKAEP